MSGFIQSGRFGAAAFDPSDISGLVLWLDAADTATITSSGGLVSVWADKSASALDASQSTDALKFTTGATSQNGLNVLDAGGADLMTIGSGVRLGRDVLSTFFVVVNKAAVTDKTVVFRSADGAAYFEVCGSSSAGATNLQQGGRSAAGPSINTGTWYVLHGGSITSGLYSRFGTSGVFGSTSTWMAGAGSDLTQLAYHPNSTYAFQGSIAEIVFYNGVELSNADQNLVGNYLSTKWATTAWSNL